MSDAHKPIGPSAWAKVLEEWPEQVTSAEEAGRVAERIANRALSGQGLTRFAHLSNDELLKPISLAPDETGAPEGPEEDSGVIALDTDSERGLVARAAQTPLASSALFGSNEPSSLSPSPSPSRESSPARTSQPPLSRPPLSLPPLSQPAVSTPDPASGRAGLFADDVPASAIAPAHSTSRVGTAARGKKTGAALVGGGIVALAALAAGAFFVMQRPHEAPPRAVATAPTEIPLQTAPEVPAPIAAPPSSPSADAPSATGAASSSEEDKLAATSATQSNAKNNAVGGGASRPTAKHALAAVNDKARPPAPKPTQPPPRPTAGIPGAAMKQAAGPAVQDDADPAAPSSFDQGSVPQKPSQGAVTGALGAALPGARACLQPDDPVLRATITFASTGSVATVSVSEGAIGAPAEACIKAALSKARVPPFALPTYSATVTVRPSG